MIFCRPIVQYTQPFAHLKSMASFPHYCVLYLISAKQLAGYYIHAIWNLFTLEDSLAVCVYNIVDGGPLRCHTMLSSSFRSLSSSRLFSTQQPWLIDLLLIINIRKRQRKKNKRILPAFHQDSCIVCVCVHKNDYCDDVTCQRAIRYGQAQAMQ